MAKQKLLKWGINVLLYMTAASIILKATVMLIMAGVQDILNGTVP